MAAHLRELEIPASPDDVVTSAQAVASLLTESVTPGSAVLVVGGEGLDAALLERGFRPVRRMDEGLMAVAQGFSPDVGRRMVAGGTYAVRAGLPWVARNLDLTAPAPRGLVPGNGALVEVIAQATGRRPVAAGKPELPLHAEAVRRTGASRPLVVGDRLDTDVEGSNRAGVARDLLTGLTAAHPPVVQTPSGWRCGGWLLRVDGDAIDVQLEGDTTTGSVPAASPCGRTPASRTRCW